MRQYHAIGSNAEGYPWVAGSHAHHLMGTVTAIDAAHLEHATPDGKPASVGLTPATKVFRDKKQVARSELKKGTRVMVNLAAESHEPKALTIYIGEM